MATKAGWKPITLPDPKLYPNVDGRPIWEPPVIRPNEMISEGTYEKRREAVMQHYNNDVVKTTKFLDEHEEIFIRHDSMEWVRGNIELDQDDWSDAPPEEVNERLAFFIGLLETLHAEHAGRWALDDRPDVELWFELWLNKLEDDTWKMMAYDPYTGELVAAEEAASCSKIYMESLPEPSEDSLRKLRDDGNALESASCSSHADAPGPISLSHEGKRPPALYMESLHGTISMRNGFDKEPTSPVADDVD